MVKNNLFRSDLYYRLKGAVLTTQPLTQHKEDIPSLVRYFLSLQGKDIPKDLDQDALGMLLTYSWPGNVREMRYTMEVIGHASIGMPVVTAAVVASVLGLNDYKKESSLIFKTYAEEKEELIRQFELEYFSRLLIHFKGNVSKAAETAGMYRPNFSKKLKAVGIDPGSFRNGKE